ncbi:methyl-accepting chemotaxis sensory transducer [Desulfofundulus kuznetsovii DSM 6115]|uniref:Methyl-accepting chemotaxis sensory transducer n=2 Tax=Desulfofundulus TaxID=2282741 RepID=A0AAU8PWP2_DESK7|nr:methyl-accepting chemotaxis sensory transducer [Desulfofundulus kuznetsovii DSM 6115]
MRLNIMGKLMLGFGAVLLLMLGTCLFLIMQMRNMNNDYTGLIKIKALAYGESFEALAHYNAAAAYLRQYILTREEDLASRYQQSVKNGDDKLGKIAPLLERAEEKDLLQKFQAQAADFKQEADQIISLVKASKSASEGERAVIEERLAQIESRSTVVRNLISAGTALADFEKQVLDDDANRTLSRANRDINISIILVAVTIVLGLILALFIARMITAPIRLLDAGAAKIAAGDLSGEGINLKTKDEAGRLAESFNTMLYNLKEIVRHLQEKSDVLTSSASELSASAQNVSAGASETASTISQVAGTVEQVTSNVSHIAEMAELAAGHAREGSEGIRNIRMQMDAIQQAAAGTGEVIRNLYETTSRITQIVELITHITDQTNLLALNAAIEAARAGEHGRGFAVVAEEVRKLAGQSAGAAKEIYALITTIQQESQKAVQSMEMSVTRVENGVQVVEEVGVTFERIIEAVQKLAGEIREVAEAAEEMSSAVQNVAAAAEEQTAAMEEVSSTTQNLAGLAGELDTLAGHFKLA